MAYGTVNADVIQTSTSGGILGAGNASIMKNRIQNGAMVIDQRNAGASVTSATNGGYTLDRWAIQNNSGASRYTIQQNAGSVTPPTGFSNYLGCTSTSAYTVGSGDALGMFQRIEGFNTSDLGWGTANAKTVTLSFQVRSSLTGTFGGAIKNSADDYSYPFTYTISSANTWTTISVTIAGPTSGTWVGATNGTGVMIIFALGTGSTLAGTAGSWSANGYYGATGQTQVVATNGATWYVTGVQLEVGSSATGFEYRLYNQELSACQRYYEKSYSINVTPATNTAFGTVSLFTSSTPVGYLAGSRSFLVSKRTSPTITIYSPSGTSGTVADGNTTDYGAGTANQIGTNGFGLQNTSGSTYSPAGNLIYFHYTASAEL